MKIHIYEKILKAKYVWTHFVKFTTVNCKIISLWLTLNNIKILMISVSQFPHTNYKILKIYWIIITSYIKVFFYHWYFLSSKWQNVSCLHKSLNNPLTHNERNGPLLLCERLVETQHLQGLECLLMDVQDVMTAANRKVEMQIADCCTKNHDN